MNNKKTNEDYKKLAEEILTNSDDWTLETISREYKLSEENAKKVMSQIELMLFCNPDKYLLKELKFNCFNCMKVFFKKYRHGDYNIEVKCPYCGHILRKKV